MKLIKVVQQPLVNDPGTQPGPFYFPCLITIHRHAPETWDSERSCNQLGVLGLNLTVLETLFFINYDLTYGHPSHLPLNVPRVFITVSLSNNS